VPRTLDSACSAAVSVEEVRERGQPRQPAEVPGGVDARWDGRAAGTRPQRKIAAYQQLQHDTTGQLYSVSSALLVPDDRTLEATLRQLNQFGYDLDRLAFVAQDEVALFERVREDYEEFIKTVTQVIELIRKRRAAEGR